MKSLFLLSSAALLAFLPWEGSTASRNDEVARAAARRMAAHVVGPGECEDCHEAEVSALHASGHWKGFPAGLSGARGKAMAEAMGIARPTDDWRCLRCHATPILKNEKLTVLGGVSCESCHGAAEDWMDLHDDYGDGEKEEESAEHAAERIAATVKAGMRRPDRVREVAESCVACHVVDDRKLVEKAGHPTGEGFEFLSWSQGEVRHNYMQSDGEKNLPASARRRRIVFLVGQLTALERLAPLAGAAAGDGAHAVSLRSRRNAAAQAVKRADDLLGEASRLKELVKVLEASKGRNDDGGKVAELARQAADLYSRWGGGDLSPLDVMLPQEVKGRPAR